MIQSGHEPEPMVTSTTRISRNTTPMTTSTMPATRPDGVCAWAAGRALAVHEGTGPGASHGAGPAGGVASVWGWAGGSGGRSTGLVGESSPRCSRGSGVVIGSPPEMAQSYARRLSE